MPWYPGREPFDKVWLAQKWSPGLCEIVGAASPRSWEETESYGFSGAGLKFIGIGLARFTLRIRLYTDDDWDEWYRFKPLVDAPPPGLEPLAVDIWHPVLVDQGVFAIGVEELGAPQQTADGEWTIDVKCVEYRPPKKFALATPKGAAATPTTAPPSAAGVTAAEERDALQDQIAAATKRLTDLLAKGGKT